MVIITATIAVPSTTTAAAVQASLSTALATTGDATNALGVTVEAVPIIATSQPSGPPPPSAPPGDVPIVAIIGIVAGGCVGLLTLVGVGARCMMRGRKRTTGIANDDPTDAAMQVTGVAQQVRV